MYNRFFKLNIWKQIMIVFIISIIIVVLFAKFFNSTQMSMKLFLDPSSLADINKPIYFVVSIIEVIVGIIIFGFIVSILTNSIFEIAERNRLREIHNVLKEAFETHSLIRVRKLLKENNVKTRRRNLNLQEAEVLLEISKDDIVKAIREYGNMRLRTFKTNYQVFIEDFFANKRYGCFLDRNSDISIISTQNYSDANTGHFSSTLASILNTNYISNEFYSSGSLLKNKKINFASNKVYKSMNSDEKSVIGNFIADLKILSNKSKIFIYLGTFGTTKDRKEDILLMFGGKKGDSFYDVENPTYDNLEKLENMFISLKSKFEEMDLLVGTHDLFSNTNKNHLSQAIHNNFHKNTISLYISTGILWMEDEEKYYKILITLASELKKL
jgi:type II secretory pathway pseudopilin PulG